MHGENITRDLVDNICGRKKAVIGSYAALTRLSVIHSTSLYETEPFESSSVLVCPR